MATYGYMPQQYAAAMQYAAYGGYDMATYVALQQQQLAAAQQQAAAQGNTALVQQLQQQSQQLQQQLQQAQLQQQQQVAAAAAAQGQTAPAQAQATSSGLTVTGCANETVGNIVRGSYVQHAENHERPVYRRTEQANNLDVLIYFWDDRDGASFCGWWFGPKVGGDQVWAYNPDKSMTPPTTGWRVPYDGPVDSTFALAAAPAPPPQPGQANFDIQAYYKKQEEERLRQQQQLELQRRQLEEARQAEQQRKRQEEARARLEQHAAQNARNAIHNLKQATPESFAELCRTLQAVLSQELPRCGSLAQRVQQEAGEMIQQATLQIEAQKEQRRKDEERRVEEGHILQQFREDNAKVQAELAALVEKAEGTCGKLKEAAAPVQESGAALTAPQAADLQQAITAAAAETRAAASEALAFVLAQRARVDPAAALELKSQGIEATRFVDEARQQLLKLQQRIGECLRLTITSCSAAKAACEGCVKRDSASRIVNKRVACFDKYDANKDGCFNATEFIAFAKGEYGFVASGESATAVLARLAETPAGVPKARFHEIRLAVGMLREEAASRERVRKAEEQRKLLEQKKAGYLASAGAIEAELTAFGTEVAKVEEVFAPLQLEAIAKYSCKELREQLAPCEAQLKASLESSEKFRNKVKDLEATVAEPELAMTMRLECRRLEVKIEHLAPRLAQASSTLESAKMHLARQEQRELDQLRYEAARAVKEHSAEKKLSREDLLKAFDKDGDGKVSSADFVGFLEGCSSLKMERSNMELLFQMLDEEKSGAISQDALTSFVRVFYRVIQDTVITTACDIKESKAVRRLETDEMIEALEGPVVAEDVKVSRVRACALKDNSEGWVTIQGDSGTVFLEEHVPVFRICTAVPLTKSLEASSEMLRTMTVGDAVEVLEWDKHDEAGNSRIRVRTRGGEERLAGWLPGPAGGEVAVIRLEPRTS